MTTYGATDNPVPSTSTAGESSQTSNGGSHRSNGYRRVHSTMEETEEELNEDELEAYEDGILTWDKAKSWKFWVRKEWTAYYLALLLIVIIVALMAFFHHHIVAWLEPFIRAMQDVRCGWLIPVAMLFVLSFPPLFGNEIVIILAGLVWGLYRGFAIVAAGVTLGEGGVYLQVKTPYTGRLQADILLRMFKYLCAARAKRMTRKSLNYACLSEAVREGGFFMAWVVRLSVLPTHFSTAIFAVCGLKWYHFFAALILGLPKQFLAIYIGVVLGRQRPSTTSQVISDCVFISTAMITLAALYFIYRRMLAVRKRVIIEMRQDLLSHGVKIPRGYDADALDTDGEDSISDG